LENTGIKEAEERTEGMEQTIIRLLAELMEQNPEAVSWNSDTDILNEIGVDSLQLVRLLLKLEEELNLMIDYDALTFDDLATIGTLASFLSRCKR
jgi:acyl carrier protein